MSDPCQAIREEIAALRDEILGAQAELHNLQPEDPREPGVGPAQKAQLIAQIKRLTAALNAKEDELKKCVEPEIIFEIEPPVTCALNGSATLTTSDSRFAGPFGVLVTAMLTFSGIAHSRVTATLDPISLGPFSLPLGCSVRLSIAPQGTVTGTFDRDGGPIVPAGTLDMTLTLNVTTLGGGGIQCFWVPSGTSALAGALTTRSAPSMVTPGMFLMGAPLNRTSGAITLVGSSVAAGGPLNGTAVDTIITGTLSQPLP
jgi:hypothetical protein